MVGEAGAACPGRGGTGPGPGVPCDERPLSPGLRSVASQLREREWLIPGDGLPPVESLCRLGTDVVLPCLSLRGEGGSCCCCCCWCCWRAVLFARPPEPEPEPEPEAAGREEGKPKSEADTTGRGREVSVALRGEPSFMLSSVLCMGVLGGG